MYDEPEFDIFSNVLNYGNRTDLQVGDGRPEEEDWYSWEAEEIIGDLRDGFGVPQGAAIVKVYGDSIRTRKIIVAWAEVDDDDA